MNIIQLLLSRAVPKEIPYKPPYKEAGYSFKMLVSLGFLRTLSPRPKPEVLSQPFGPPSVSVGSSSTKA